MKKLSWGLKRFNVMLDRWRSCPGLPNNTSENPKQMKVISWSVVDQATDKKWYKNSVTRYVVPCSVNFKIKGRLRLLALGIVSTCASEKKGNILGLGHFLHTWECDDEWACYLIIKKHIYSKTKYVNIPSFHSFHPFNSPLKLKFRQSTIIIL